MNWHEGLSWRGPHHQGHMKQGVEGGRMLPNVQTGGWYPLPLLSADPDIFRKKSSNIYVEINVKKWSQVVTNFTPSH